MEEEKERIEAQITALIVEMNALAEKLRSEEEETEEYEEIQARLTKT